MTSPEATTMTELIEDCAHIPFSVRYARHPLPLPRPAVPWQVDERCTSQVQDLDEYV